MLISIYAFFCNLATYTEASQAYEYYANNSETLEIDNDEGASNPQKDNADSNDDAAEGDNEDNAALSGDNSDSNGNIDVPAGPTYKSGFLSKQYYSY